MYFKNNLRLLFSPKFDVKHLRILSGLVFANIYCALVVLTFGRILIRIIIYCHLKKLNASFYCNFLQYGSFILCIRYVFTTPHCLGILFISKLSTSCNFLRFQSSIILYNYTPKYNIWIICKSFLKRKRFPHQRKMYAICTF